MDYGQEFEKMKESSEGLIFKPELGVNKVQIVSEGEETFFEDMDGTKTPQIKFKVVYKKEEKDWYVGIGKTTESLYGQLMALGKYKGKLEGETITLMANKTKRGEKEVNSYTVVEAVEILPKLEHRKKQEHEDKLRNEMVEKVL